MAGIDGSLGQQIHSGESRTLTSSLLTNSDSSCNSSRLWMQNSLNANSDTAFYHDWLRPPLPRLQFTGDALLPADTEVLQRLDTPLCLYRRRRLLRALGQLPQTQVLPEALAVSPTPAVGSTAGCQGPFRGEFAATLWNAQAFFCVDEVKFNAKTAYAGSLLDRSDMLLLNEAHGTDGGNKAWRPPIGTTAWWSAGPTVGHAGIGIIVKDSFLRQFSGPHRWHIIWPGRAAILSFRGPHGSLDVVVAYFHTGWEVREMDKFGVHPQWMEYCNSFPRLREHLRNRISAAIQSRDRVLTLFGADCNWAPQGADRRAKSTMDATGSRNDMDERHFQATMCQKHGLVELHQPEMTHSGSVSLSRLDRFYLNHHLSEQIDRELQAVALEWRRDISDHRAVFVARRLPAELDASARPISQSVYSHEDFPRRCKLTYEEKLRECPDASKLKRLVLLKETIKEVANNMASTEVGHTVATDTSDKLGVVMRFLRAAEKEAFNTVSQCLLRYPHIATLVDNPYDLSGNLAVKLRSLKDHAVELARELALEQMRSAQDDSDGHDNFEKDKRKKKGMRLLHRLAPGKSGAIGAVIDNRGKFLTDPQAMANHLRLHWANVFKAKGVNQERLQAWLDEDSDGRAEQGPTHEGLRSIRLKRRAIRQALKQSNNSSPGPDGIPYGAWRALGEVAVDVLYGAFGDLIRDEGPEIMRRDYPDFNASLLFFLPRLRWCTSFRGIECETSERHQL